MIQARFQQLRSLIRLKPFNTATVEGRARERHRRVLLTAMASAVAKAISILTMLVTVPLTIGYLGEERYGMWMTISSFIAILSFADLGIGNGLLNAVSEAHGAGDRDLAREYVSSAVFTLTGIALVFGISLAVSFRRIPWAGVFNVESVMAAREAGPAMAVYALCFLLNIPLGVVQRVQMGYQEGFVNSIWTSVGSVLGLFGVLLTVKLGLGLPWLVLAIAGAPVLATLTNGALLFGRQRPWIRPRWRLSTRRATRRVLQLGMLFLALQIAVALAFSSDNIIAAQVLGPGAVTQYSVPMRLFSIAPTLLQMYLVPLWPAYGESLARGDTAWARRSLFRSVVLAAVVTGLPSLLIVVFGTHILRLWVGSQIAASSSLLLGLGIWSAMSAVGSAFAMFLNGLSVVGFQVVISLVMAAAAVILKILLARSVGLEGIVWGKAAAYLIFALLPTAIYSLKIISEWDRRTVGEVA